MCPEQSVTSAIETFIKGLQFKVSDQGRKKIEAACAISRLGHKNQRRMSGEPYFMHPLRVAMSLVHELGVLDSELVIAAILHDTMEDVPELTRAVLATIFGKRVAGIVSNLTSPVDHDDPNYVEQRKIYFAHLRSCRVEEQLVKLADRLDNVRTLDACTPEKRKAKIRQTIEHILPLLVSVEKENPVIAGILREKYTQALKVAEAL